MKNERKKIPVFKERDVQNEPMPGFKPATAAQQASTPPLCHHVLVVKVDGEVSRRLFAL